MIAAYEGKTIRNGPYAPICFQEGQEVAALCYVVIFYVRKGYAAGEIDLLPHLALSKPINIPP